MKLLLDVIFLYRKLVFYIVVWIRSESNVVYKWQYLCLVLEWQKRPFRNDQKSISWFILRLLRQYFKIVCIFVLKMGFFFVHLYQLKRFLSGIIIVLFFLKYISIHFVQSNLKPGSNRLRTVSGYIVAWCLLT